MTRLEAVGLILRALARAQETADGTEVREVAGEVLSELLILGPDDKEALKSFLTGDR
jgi:hypothetical protein